MAGPHEERRAVDEFLDKLQEDQRRMRKFLRSHGRYFARMAETLAVTRSKGARVFLLGEPPLEGFVPVLAYEYLSHLPALPVDLDRGRPPSVDPGSEDEIPTTARGAAALQTGRHLHPGDVVLAFLHDGVDPDTMRVLELADDRGITVLVVCGLGAKALARRYTKRPLALPTRGIKTVCESLFICTRILARISRASLGEVGIGDEARLVQTECGTCNERVFFEERLRGRRASCPLCEGKVKVPKDSGRRLAAPGPEPQRRRRLKPSVLELPTLDLDALDSGSGSPPPDPSREAPHGLISGDAGGAPSVPEPSFGSDIVVGSSVVSVTPDEEDGVDDGRALSVTASADPFALEDAFLADLEMPAPRSASSSAGVSSGADDGLQLASGSRRLSARYTAEDCTLRWGRGGFPDQDSPRHQLLALSERGLEFVLDPDDPAGTTLQVDDELYLRIEIPAFIEPILVRGRLDTISGTAGDGGDGARLEIDFRDAEPAARRKLERAAENLRAPAP